MKKIIFLILTLNAFLVSSQSIVGQWETVDDITDEPKSVVEIYKVGNKYFGKIVKIVKLADKNALCEKCKGTNHKKPILGMVIIKDLVQNDNEFESGKILDPENGKTYGCKIWIEDKNKNHLNVRGYIGFLFRTQKWKRVK